MIKGLYRRLALVLFTVFLALGAVLFWVYDNATHQLQQETAQQLNLNLASNLVSEIELFPGDELSQETVKQAFSKIMYLDPGTELYVISLTGEVLGYDAPEEKIINRSIDLAPVNAFISNKEFKLTLGDDPRSERQKAFSAAPILNQSGLPLAYLYIIIQGEVYDDAASLINANKTWLISLSIIAAALAFLLLTALLLFYKLTRPLVQLNKEVAALEESNFQQLVNAAEPLNADGQPKDELQALRGSFYRMGHKIVDQISTLKKHDQMRREFLAHVSHDLRTPLAGMRAYLETLQLKGDELSESDRDDFLKKALLTNHKLSGMIDELFELARIEHGQVAVNPEQIRLSDLLSDMYGSLSGLANNKGIHLAVDMAREDVNVMADVARLDRVLQNLVGNAILYTPAGGTVTIRVSDISNGKVQLAVEDTGQGIAAEDLPYVFEPYFRSTNGQQAYHKGKGLGLAIASKLLALHDAKLTVESELGTGTRFEFELDGA
ncbi:hypothetical protein EOL70_15970 [Leucothrix sargassi]|nr:hypothetical protein EOL70_15970 [Leucothrix sargassi]